MAGYLEVGPSSEGAQDLIDTLDAPRTVLRAENDDFGSLRGSQQARFYGVVLFAAILGCSGIALLGRGETFRAGRSRDARRDGISEATKLFVAQTWDHYRMPACDEGPPYGAMRTEKKPVTKVIKQDVGTDVMSPVQVPVDVPYQEPVLQQVGDATVTIMTTKYRREYHTELKMVHQEKWVPKEVTVWETQQVPNEKNKAQEECTKAKEAANQRHDRMVAAHWGFVHYRDSVRDLHIWQEEHDCPSQLVNVDYRNASVQWQDGGGNPSGGHCQRQCTFNPDCEGFSWFNGQCYLKRLPKHKRTFNIHRGAIGVYSGHRCNPNATKTQGWIFDEKAKHTLPAVTVDDNVAPDSLLCMELVVPFSYEVTLLINQHKHGYSIFGCEKWVVYSSQKLNMMNGKIHTRLIRSSQYAESGGQWGTALNTDIFMALWRQVIEDGDYLKARWVVKVDPDTVWFPLRLQALLRQPYLANQTHGPGTYLNNCKDGLHGPIEIFSQRALKTFAEISPQCFDAMNGWGNWQLGEDAWMDQCLLSNGGHGVRRIFEGSLLAEAHCFKWQGWEQCWSQGMIAFHPFKDVNAWNNCMSHSDPNFTNPLKKTVAHPHHSEEGKEHHKHGHEHGHKHEHKHEHHKKLKSHI